MSPEVQTAQSLFTILPNLTPTVVALLILAAGFWVFLRELKEREIAMRVLEKEIRDKIMQQLDKNTEQLSKNTEMLAGMVSKIISR